MTRRTVIVTDGDQRAALSVVRSLGAAGYRCVVTSAAGRSIAGASRFAARDIATPDPLRRPDDFVDAIVRLAAEERAALVIPIAEPAMLALLPARARLAPAVVPFPDVEHFRALSDKQALLVAAESLGISVPAQHVVAEAADVPALDADALAYPLVLKPARSVGEHGGVRSKLSVSYASDAAELRARLAQLPPAAFPLLLQQRIDGDGIGIFLLTWQGRERARFAHRRITEKPPSGGVSVYRESVRADDHLVERSRALLEHFGWYGVAMVEYKRDARTGRPYLMEVNGRFWGSLQLAVDAGVDFPRLLAACALDEADDREPPRYRTGVRSRWWWGQVDHVIARVRRRRSLASRVPYPMARSFADLVVGLARPHDREEMLRPGDPMPFVRETLRWVRGA